MASETCPEAERVSARTGGAEIAEESFSPLCATLRPSAVTPFLGASADATRGRDGYNGRPMLSKRFYLDHAASAPLRSEVQEAMEASRAACGGNPSSLHAEGRAAREALEAARDAIARALNARGFRVVFTSGGTEADNAAVLGTLLAAAEEAPRAGGGALHAVASAVEHPAVLNGLFWGRRMGFESTLVGVDAEGRVDPHDVESALRPSTRLISVMTANNEVGTIQPIAEIGEIARRRGIALHTDAVQALGQLPLDLAEMPADIVTFSAHKIHGPIGVGALCVREGTRFEGLQKGGAQENGLRAGTEAVALAVGMARAVELAHAEREGEAARLAALRERLWQGIRDIACKARRNTPARGVLPHILNVSFAGANGESLLKALDRLGVAVSTGSACNTGSQKPSHVLEAMGRSEEAVRGSIRFSLGRENDEPAIDGALSAIEEALDKLGRIAGSGLKPTEAY